MFARYPITNEILDWNSFWFSPADAFDLGVARALILAYFLFFKLTEKGFDLDAWSKAYLIFRDQWQKPFLIRILRINIDPTKYHSTLILIYKVSLFFGVVGLFTQFSCLIALLLGLYLLAIRHGLRTHHTVIPIHFCLLCLALAPSGDAFSIDSLIRNYLNLEFSPQPELYGWAITLIRVTLSLVIFATGISKLRHIRNGHYFWKKGHLSDILRLHDFPFFFVRPQINISSFMRKNGFIEFAAALGTVAFECIFPIVLFFPILALPFIVALISMLIGFRVFIGARFDFFSAIAVAVYFPWNYFLSS